MLKRCGALQAREKLRMMLDVNVVKMGEESIDHVLLRSSPRHPCWGDKYLGETP